MMIFFFCNLVQYLPNNFDNGDWVVAPVDDDKYKFELISSVMTVKGSVI